MLVGKPVLSRAIFAVGLVLASAFAIPVAAGQIEDAQSAYLRGDYATALQLAQPLADRGDVVAQAQIGQMYEAGLGVSEDYAQALLWYQKAADQGFILGQYLLGTMYERGEGVPQDFVLAHMWYNIAASHGDPASPGRRDALGARMTSEQIAEAQKLARDWAAAHVEARRYWGL